MEKRSYLATGMKSIYVCAGVYTGSASVQRESTGEKSKRGLLAGEKEMNEVTVEVEDSSIYSRFMCTNGINNFAMDIKDIKTIWRE